MNSKLQDSQDVTGASRKRKSTEPSTSTQCIPITTINENTERDKHSEFTWPRFNSATSPIKGSSPNNSLCSASFELTHSPSPKTSSKSANYPSIHQPPNVNKESNPNFSIPPLSAEPEILIEQNTVEHFVDEIPRLNSKSTVNLEENQPEIDADLVVELATGTFAGDPKLNNGDEIETGNRQFPGPAGILPRLHTGLESNPRLATLMRLHKGRDLKKFSDQTSSYSPASKSKRQ